ncbi:arylesterase [Hymenobacter cheonanensis]|uniref:arylesterase n=1 Tax=Hymenobacter sp. CA2-7 TaxID=3063993 RepID=UPI002713A5B4|nr:arylesterase [Hymenobacter sp. CA2-7]MDO7887155.1 arylesterase [Hymenobacter sp. CA2-7]
MKYLPGSALLLALLAAGCQSDSSSATKTPASPAATAEAPAPKGQAAILFFGDSITAGLGVEPDEAYPALIEARVDSLHLPYTVVNAGLSGETTAGGRSRIGWVLSRQPVGVFVLELGGNDGLRGLPLTDTRKNLQAIIDTVRQKAPQAKIVLAGMQIPPNMGAAYAADFKKLYAETAARNKLTLIPFLLENVGGIAKLNQRDGIHPTPEGHKLVARTVWRTLQPIL